MNRSDFISYIQHPDKLTIEAATNLSGLIRDFPYFQTAHLLYTKNLYNQNSIHYSNQLKIAAAYSGDRKVLYNLIYDKNKIVPATNDLETVVVQQPNIVDKPVEAKKISLEHHGTIPDTRLERDIMSEVVSSYIGIEVDEEIAQLKEEEKSPLSPEKVDLDSPDVRKADAGKAHSFIEWLKITTKSNADEDRTQEAGEKIEQGLIDKFILEAPRISKPKAEFFSPIDMARKGLEEGTVVSETLAKIYEAQGHFSKAIRAYEGLILKYPEKKLFFAARITELKKKQNF